MEGCPHKAGNWFLQADPHDAFPLPLPPIALHIAGDRLLAPWLMSGSHKLNKLQILADGDWVASRGHAATLFLHWNLTPPWPPNALLPIIILFSESKCQFAAGSIQGPDGPLAVAIDRTEGLNLACGDPVSVPTSCVFTGGTVLLGFTLADVLAGLRAMAQDMLVSGIGSMVGGPIGDALKKPLSEAMEDVVEEMIGEVGEDSIEEFVERLWKHDADEILEENAKGLVEGAVAEDVDSTSELLLGD